jgi:nucleoside-diphosphate-sugar epimerase
MLAPVSDTPTTFSEADWNDAAIRAVQGGSTNPFVVYAASKTLAEKAAWEFHNTHKPAWDIATLNPPFVYGPTLLPAKTPADIGGTQGIWYGTVIAAGNKDKERLGEKNGYAWVDVRDIAEAHVRALEKEEAGGQRIVVSSGSYIWQEWFDVANAVSQSPDFSLRDHPPKGFPELTSGDVTHLAKFDNAKSERVLGLKYRGKEDTVRDILEDAGERGWVAKAD